MSKLHIIVGTVSGTALEAAEIASQQLSLKGHEVKLNAQFQAVDLQNAKDEITLICTSNTGMGDLPANITPLLIHLSNDYPNISGASYAIVNLGDSSYPNFAQAGRTLDEALQDLGAQALVEMLVIDALYDDDLECVLLPWLDTLAGKLS